MNRLTTSVVVTATLAAAAVAPMTSAFSAGDNSPDRAALMQSARTHTASTRAALGLPSNEGLVVKDVIKDADGSTHIRYDRTFKGLRVIGGDFVAHENAHGGLETVSWNRSGAVAVRSVKPQVSLSSAKAKASHTFARTKATKDGQRGELVVYAGAARPRLAYDVVTTGVRDDQVPSRLHTIVDARTGAVLTTWDEIETGQGHGIYVGNVTVGTQAHTGGGFEMKDATGNYSTDVHNQGDPNTGTGPDGDLFLDSDDTWGTGVYTDRASAAVDAQYGAEKTFDFYKNVLGRNGIWNDGRGARSRVHFADQMQNAFWDGTQMSYGDGLNNAAPLVELDVAGHEMSHGVTENTAGLAYSGDAGGLNEATSDIFGTSVEWYTNNANDVPDYLIGEELNLRGNGTPLRWMDKPSKDGLSDDCWSTATGGKNPHYSSGPLNHWFYLASEGSGAKTINGVSYDSPTCNGSTVTPIGRDKAEKIWYRTLSTYLTSNSNYAAARNGAIKSAKDLYPTDNTVCQGVADAFSAISVPAGTETCGTTTGVTVTNPGSKTGTVGTAITSFTLTASGGTSPYTYTATGLPPGVSISSAGAVSGTPTTAGTYTTTVTAKDSSTTPKTGSATFTFTIAGGGGGGGTNLLLNPGFESGAVNWTGTAGPITTNSGRPAHSGTWKMWLGGNGYTATENESQNITIPSTASAAQLSYWIRTDTNESGSTVYDRMKVQIIAGGVTTTLKTFTNVGTNSTYTQFVHDLSAYKGQTITVKFLMTEDSSLQTSFVVDDTAVTTS